MLDIDSYKHMDWGEKQLQDDKIKMIEQEESFRSAIVDKPTAE
jgi:hypothetical protein